MKRSLFSCLTLTGALLLSTAAFSQTMIDGKEVSAADLPKVQAACDALAAKDAGSTASTSTDANKTTSTDANADKSTTAASSSSGDAAAKTDAGANAATAASIDVATLTLDQCKTAGLIKTP